MRSGPFACAVNARGAPGRPSSSRIVPSAVARPPTSVAPVASRSRIVNVSLASSSISSATATVIVPDAPSGAIVNVSLVAV